MGAFQQAEELRNFRAQSRTEVVMPSTFADPELVFEPILKQIATWFTRFEVRAPLSRSVLICPLDSAGTSSRVQTSTILAGGQVTFNSMGRPTMQRWDEVSLALQPVALILGLFIGQCRPQAGCEDSISGTAEQGSLRAGVAAQVQQAVPALAGPGRQQHEVP